MIFISSSTCRYSSKGLNCDLSSSACSDLDERTLSMKTKNSLFLRNIFTVLFLQWPKWQNGKHSGILIHRDITDHEVRPERAEYQNTLGLDRKTFQRVDPNTDSQTEPSERWEFKGKVVSSVELMERLACTSMCCGIKGADLKPLLIRLVYTFLQASSTDQ